MEKKASILIVDDNAANLRLLAGMLKEKNYVIRPVSSGALALQVAHKLPPDLILLDINMPGMNGFEVCKCLKSDEQLKEIPVIFISAMNETTDKVKAFSMGGVDYITKPFQFDEVIARVETHLHIRRLTQELEKHNSQLEEMVQQQVKEISDSQIATIIAMAKLSEYRDDDTGHHLDRIQIFCKLLAAGLSEKPGYNKTINQEYMKDIYLASSLHDIGKVGIRDSILLKPGKLTKDEFEEMKQHTIIGARALCAVSNSYPKNAFVNMGIAVALFHHEKWDGSGYPYGIAGKNIPTCARIMAVADVYDALRSRRVYKPAFSHEKSREIIISESGTRFDPMLVEIFLEKEAEFREIRDSMSGAIYKDLSITSLPELNTELLRIMNHESM